MKLLDHDAWAYTDDLIQTYGPVAKLHRFLGVRLSRLWYEKETLTLWHRLGGCMCTTPERCMRSSSRTKTRTYSCVTT